MYSWFSLFLYLDGKLNLFLQLIVWWGTDSSNTEVLNFTMISYTVIVSHNHLDYPWLNFGNGIFWFSYFVFIVKTSVLLWSGGDEQKPNNDLPNQEKNQYRTVYWWETETLYTGDGSRFDWTSERELNGNWLRWSWKASCNNIFKSNFCNEIFMRISHFRYLTGYYVKLPNPNFSNPNSPIPSHQITTCQT